MAFPVPRLKRGHQGVSKILRLMLPAVIGSSVMQINLILDELKDKKKRARQIKKLLAEVVGEETLPEEMEARLKEFEPKTFDPDATANAVLGARLPYLFATCRFAHYLKCIVRDKVGSFKERAEMQSWLQKWILQYVDGDPSRSSEESKARKPLAAAEVTVEEVEGNPGYYTSNFYLRPHYQLEGLTVSLRLVSKLPSVKN